MSKKDPNVAAIERQIEVASVEVLSSSTSDAESHEEQVVAADEAERRSGWKANSVAMAAGINRRGTMYRLVYDFHGHGYGLCVVIQLVMCRYTHTHMFPISVCVSKRSRIAVVNVVPF